MQPERLPIPPGLSPELAPYFESPRRDDGRYRNPWAEHVLPSLVDVLRWKARPNLARPPGYRPRPVSRPGRPLADFEALATATTRLLWIGHASFLLEMDGVRIAIDPVFGRAGGLVPRITPAAVEPQDLRDIDAVLVTHGHHDHFDRGGLRAIARANGSRTRFIVPRDLARALPAECRLACELDWWERVPVGSVEVCLVPAQHWHRRGAFDTNDSLWGGFVVRGSHCVYHSGDTGYFEGFRAIGQVLGPIDVACLPLGAYEPRWFMAAQHMSPEGSLQALDDLDARHLLGMHWGAYDLSDEPIDAGPKLLLQAAVERRTARERLHVLQPGGSFALPRAGSAESPVVLHRHVPGGA